MVKRTSRSIVSSPQTWGAGGASLVPLLTLSTLLLASLPYLWGYFLTPPGTQFVGTAYNIDDYCNYLSWLRQSEDGHFFLRNLFTTDAQKGLEFNVFFWSLGRLAHILHLPSQAVLQVARVGGGALLLLVVWRFYCFCLPRDKYARLTAFAFVCLSSGWGWLTWQNWADKNPSGSPTDAWQPEAYTFLSLYTSPLFVVSTLLIVSALFALLKGEATGKIRYAVYAGLCGAVLGNMHSYDVLHLAAAWGLFLLVWTVLQKGRGVAGAWGRGILALALTLPTTLYQYYVFRAEAVFHQRAEVATLSPSFDHYVMGYGVPFLLAIAGVVLARRNSPLPNPSPRDGERDKSVLLPSPFPLSESPVRKGEGTGEGAALLFPICWAVAGLLIVYLPVAFQRKMLMGEHVPLSLLAGFGAAALTQSLKPRLRQLTLAALVLLSLPSNLFFLRRDIVHLNENRSETQQQPFLSAGLLDAYGWIEHSTPPDAALVGFPTLCAALPGHTGRAVWAGHWGETPHYEDKIRQFSRFADMGTSDAERRAFLASTGAQFLLYPMVVAPFTDRRGRTHTYADFAHQPPPYLIPVYANKEYAVFRIALSQH